MTKSGSGPVPNQKKTPLPSKAVNNVTSKGAIKSKPNKGK